MKRSIKGAALWLGLALAASPLAAQTVTIGTETGGNMFPFGNYNAGLPNNYLQVYGAWEFGGPMWISSIGFQPYSGLTSAGFSRGEYFVSLSTTDRPPDGLSTSFLDNFDIPTVKQFFAGFLDGGFVITGDPFYYDPAVGNLLMAVTVSQQYPEGINAFAEADAKDGTSRYYEFGGDVYDPRVDSKGLVTTFNPETDAVPEPASLLLVGTGLAALARGIRRRKTT